MARYVDGYILAVPKKNLPAYRRMALKAGKIWIEHGALELRETSGEDLTVHCGTPYSKLLKLKKGETAVYSWIVYKSRADRDRINAKVMTDKRLASMMSGKKMPFDMKRMTYGGFDAMVDLTSKRR